MEIKTLFNIDDIIYFIHENNIKQGKIYGIKIHNNYNVCLKTYEIKYYDGEYQCNIELNENNIYKNQKSLTDELVLKSWKYEEQYGSFDDIEDKYPEIRKCYAYDDDEKVVEKDTISNINECQDIRINISKEDYEDFYRVTFKSIYIAVMDYRDGTIKMYTVPASILEGWQDDRAEGVEYWLCENTDYSVDECYLMFSKEPIKIIQK